MRKNLIILYFNLFLFCVFVSCINSEEKEQRELTLHVPETLIPQLPKQADFAGEELPLNQEYAKESFDLELIKNTFWHSNTILILKRSKKYFPIIEPILKEESVPDDLKYLAVAESNLDPTIVSPAKAKGLWQFLKGTGIENGLEINDWIDERSHVEKSTRAAIQYLKELKDSTGSWSLAAASYNAGLGNIRKVMKQQKFDSKKDSYFDLKLFRETERYIYRIVAYKAILENPEAFGFSLTEKDVYPFPEVDTITINSNINWHDWCDKKQISYRALLHFNPWIISDSLVINNNQSYQILIPKN